MWNGDRLLHAKAQYARHSHRSIPTLTEHYSNANALWHRAKHYRTRLGSRGAVWSTSTCGQHIIKNEPVIPALNISAWSTVALSSDDMWTSTVAILDNWRAIEDAGKKWGVDMDLCTLTGLEFSVWVSGDISPPSFKLTGDWICDGGSGDTNTECQAATWLEDTLLKG
ncbi:hypothetical protein BDN70DRAFT_977418 [Pholiota conissans]|uniref:Uncharacterized protein n=1 Tax=Pholiota conissans TaxID=109636 RepID=A0A9P6CT71_9AGAR|nr:hypothetical protein BDN70DRAFT_977418 [Pholiota conissans]